MTISTLVDQDIQPMDRLLERLDDRFVVTVGVDADEEALVDALAGRDAVFTTSRLPMTRRVLEATELDLVAKIGTGVDSIDLDAARDCGVTVVYTPGLNATSVAEHAVTLLLTVTRGTVRSGTALAAGKWRDEIPLGGQLVGGTVGVVGLGNVGTRIGKLLAGFDVDLLAYDPYVHEIDAELVDAELVAYETLLERSDAVVVAAELTEETRGLVDRDALGRMRNDAVLVNVARGPIVDQDALVEALRTDRLRGAGLDVFETEPLPPDSVLHELDSVVVTPHVAGTSLEARERTIAEIARLADRFFAEDPIDDRFVATA